MRYLVFDTETENINPESDDINIHDHHPFLLTDAVLDKQFEVIKEGIIDFNNDEDEFKNYLSKCPTIVGANIKYDVHMLLNKGYDISYFENKNYIDIQVLARLVISNDLQSEANFSVALKKLAVLYLGIDSNAEETKLKRELQGLVQQHMYGLNYHLQKKLYY